MTMAFAHHEVSSPEHKIDDHGPRTERNFAELRTAPGDNSFNAAWKAMTQSFSTEMQGFQQVLSQIEIYDPKTASLNHRYNGSDRDAGAARPVEPSSYEPEPTRQASEYESPPQAYESQPYRQPEFETNPYEQ
jgi:hypothetical protein